jgi:hypothetical protein
MVRLRLATLVVAAGLGLVCGCMSLSQFPLLGRIRARLAADCCDSSVLPDSEVPFVDGSAMNGAIPGGPGIGSMPSVTPQNTMPSLAPPPRIAPQPQAQPGPYTP